MYSGSSLHFKPVENFFHTPGYTDSCSLWRCKYTRESVVELLTNFTARTGEDLRPSYQAMTANIFNFCSQAALICRKGFIVPGTQNPMVRIYRGPKDRLTYQPVHSAYANFQLTWSHRFLGGWGCFPGLALCRWLPNAASTQGW